MFFPSENVIPWLEKAMDLSYRRHTVLSSNIANADTPGYIPQDVDFKDFLKAELNSTDSGPNPGVPHTQLREHSEPTLNGNKVDMEQEVMRMNSNRFFYFMANEMVSRNLSAIRYAIDEGGR